MSNTVPFHVVIPARFAASRLPGKPLRLIAGQPMLAHVVARARESAAVRVVVATDDARIMALCAELGVDALLTATSHRSGTDRIAEVITRCGWADDEIVVNVQGDEPGVPPALINQVAAQLATSPAAQMATLAAPITDAATLFDPQVVKVVTDATGLALYFSRAPLPWHRDAFAALGNSSAALPETLPAAPVFLRHIGLYAYRVGFLNQFVNWSPAPLEQAESLEQLRALWHGERISVALACAVPGPGVDTEADLALATRWLETAAR